MKSEIVILTRSLPFHSLGGMEIVAWDLARAFVRMGQAVRIVTTSLPGHRTEFVRDGVTIVPLAETPAGRYSAAWWRESRRHFEQHCMQTSAAVLSVSAGAFGLFPLKERLPGVPFIMQAHGTSWGEVVSKWRSRRIKSLLGSVRNLWWVPKELLAYKHFDGVVAVGPQVAEDIGGLPGKWFLPADKVHLINNGIDTTEFTPPPHGALLSRRRLNLDERAPTVVSACRLHPQKGVSNVLRTFALLLKTHPDAMLLVAGDGPEKADLEALSGNLAIQGRVKFLGALQRSELIEIYQAGDAFTFLTERVEGLPLNILEAMATGLPVLTSEHLRIFNSNNITKVNPKDFAAASKKLAQMLDNRPAEKANLLPRQYQLSFAAQAYIDLIETLTPHDSGRP
jgi:glycosyltransferase involved in cell wall biosynthesis